MSYNQMQRKTNSPDNSVELSKFNFVLKNTILIMNLPIELYSKDILYQKKYLGQFGHINHIFFDKNYRNEEKNIIVQFDTNNQAALAVLFLENFLVGKKRLKVSYFISKFCYCFLHNKKCLNKNCLYIHDLFINELLFYKIDNLALFDSFKFALSVVNISLKIITIIKKKVFKDDYFEEFKKFPKITIKKLKNKDYIKKFFPGKINDINLQSCKNSSEDDSINTNNSSKNLSDSSMKIKRKNHSRFNFVKNTNKNENYSICIPNYILDFIDNLVYSLLFNSNNNCDNNIYIDDFNCSWSLIFFGKI
jgi:hypothetical protein